MKNILKIAVKAGIGVYALSLGKKLLENAVKEGKILLR